MGMGTLYVTLGPGWHVFCNINNKVGPCGLFFEWFGIVVFYFFPLFILICVVVSCLRCFFAPFGFWCSSLRPPSNVRFLYFP